VGKFVPNSQGINTFDKAVEKMSQFENKIYSDWGQVVFLEQFIPSFETPTFLTKSIQGYNIAADSYREGNLNTVNKKIYYGWVLNYIIVAADEECLLAAMEEIYHVH
jgi:hypothetical protein